MDLDLSGELEGVLCPPMVSGLGAAASLGRYEPPEILFRNVAMGLPGCGGGMRLAAWAAIASKLGLVDWPVLGAGLVLAAWAGSASLNSAYPISIIS